MIQHKFKSFFRALSAHRRDNVRLVDSEGRLGGIAFWAKIDAAGPVVFADLRKTPNIVTVHVHAATSIGLKEDPTLHLEVCRGPILVVVIDPIPGPKLAAVGTLKAPVVNHIVAIIEQP